MRDITPAEAAFNSIHPSVIDRLDPTYVKVYNTYIAPFPPPSLHLEQARKEFPSLYRNVKGTATGVGGIGEAWVPGWRKYDGENLVRVYVPTGEEPGMRNVWPVHFNIRGGDWAFGDLDIDAHACHYICTSVPCTVIGVNYRNVPELPFPIGIMDAYMAIKHIIENSPTRFSIDTSRMTFGGVGTGGTIALILNHLLRDDGMGDMVKGVIVGTPAITDLKNFSSPGESPYPSMQENEHAPILNWYKLKRLEAYKLMSLTPQPHTGDTAELYKDAGWFLDAMKAPNFKGLAPVTWIGTAEVDPLRDEGEAYAKKMRDNGNNVITKRYPGVPHDFMQLANVLPRGAEYVNDSVSVIRQCLYTESPRGGPS